MGHPREGDIVKTRVYRRLPAETAERRTFAITASLVEGYEDGPTHPVDDAVKAHAGWMCRQIAEGRPYLTGVFTVGALSYAWPRPELAPEASHATTEPVVTFTGEINVLYNPRLADMAVEEMLDDLAGQLGAALGQVRVYVAYQDRTWVLERAWEASGE